MQVRDRRSRRRHDSDREPRFHREPDREKPRDPLVDAHPQAQQPGALEFRGREGERLRS